MIDYYRLDASGVPVLEPDVGAWARWYERVDRERQIARTDLAGGGYVSTVFLGIDHGWGEGDPVLWETMVFDTPDGDDHQERYTSREDALAGHARIVAALGGAA